MRNKLSILTLLSFVAFFGVNTLNASNITQDEVVPNENTPALAVEEDNYTQDAIALAARIVTGFSKTSYVPTVTDFIASKTKSYAGFMSGEDESESITEMYLRLGNATEVDLTDQDSVYNFLKGKFKSRVEDRVAPVTSFIGGGFGSVFNFVADKAFKTRLKQAVIWAFVNQ